MPWSLLNVALFPSVRVLVISHKLVFSFLVFHWSSSLSASPFNNDYLKFLHILSSIFIHILGPKSLLLSLIYLSDTVSVFKIMTPPKGTCSPSSWQQNKLCVLLERRVSIFRAGGMTECNPPCGRQQNGRLDRLLLSKLQLLDS